LKLTSADREDFEFLMASGRIGAAFKPDRFVHLDQPIGVLNYIRIANELAALMPKGRLLDWGCGFGQMTYLLRRRGFEVTSFDIDSDHTDLPDSPLSRSLDVIRSKHPTTLPFPDHTFDAVLSCGVLEHVDEFSQPGNEILSLREIRRVLTPRGHFPIYQLPQRYTWTEAVARTLGRYAHPRRYTGAEIRGLLVDNGFRLERLRRNNLFPKNMAWLPESVRVLYSRFGGALITADLALSRIPLLNQIAGVMEIMARPVEPPVGRAAR
jgi:SAM-dependent methyltransferase